MGLILAVIVAIWVISAGLKAGPLTTGTSTTGLVPTFIDLSANMKEVYVRGYRAGFVEKRGNEWVALTRAKKEKGRGKTPEEAASLMLSAFEVSKPVPT